ncbi:mitochondrial fission ELM1 family protein [Roseibium salinum]|uniref:mitochondrial fission ELM1 family protein n=1 Tax=Roseibium salinum TaxID=1604349 RepID=UPI0036217A25
MAPPYPDIAIASGRRAAAYLRRIKRLSGGDTFTVFLKDPRTGPDAADLIWVPEHDKLRGRNVLVTPTSPHRFSASRLAELRGEKVPEIDRLAHPRVAVLVGGDSRHHKFTEDDQSRFLAGLRRMVREDGAKLLITASRRTPAGLAYSLSSLAKAGGHLYWTGAAPNPLGLYLAKADAIVATADSTNMIGEATVTGKPVHVFKPSGGHDKITRFGEFGTPGCHSPLPRPVENHYLRADRRHTHHCGTYLTDFRAHRQRGRKP